MGHPEGSQTQVSSVLRLGVLHGVESAVRIHVERGDDLNLKDHDGRTLLMLAALKGREQICKMLLEGGADPALRDPQGKDASEIANDAGYKKISELLLSKLKKIHSESEPTRQNGNEVKSDSEVWAEERPVEFPIEPVEIGTGSSSEASFSMEENSEAFDISAWEPETIQVAPVKNPQAKKKAQQEQQKISEFKVVDFSEDWNDLSVDFLPEFARKIIKAEDQDLVRKIRLVLLRALREGSVPTEMIEKISLESGNLHESAFQNLLSRFVHDLGAELDERKEYSYGVEDYTVYVDEVESDHEEQQIDEALEAIESYENRRSDPLSHFQRDFSRVPLLNSEQEISLSQQMERGVNDALDSLARSISGIEFLVESAQKVISGKKPLRWLTDKKTDEIQNKSTDDDLLIDLDAPEDQDSVTATNRTMGIANSELNELRENVEKLWAEVRALNDDEGALVYKRSLLDQIGVARSFLLTLAEIGKISEPENASTFNCSIQSYKLARDRMIEANIRLAYSVAIKYRYSGELLDDLLQEANVGLMKAVDRFDWRRGFKFSTYATWWIRQSVYRYIAVKSRLIRLPVHVFDKAMKIEKIALKFENENSRPPLACEISKLSGIPESKVLAFQKLLIEPISIDAVDVDGMLAFDARDSYTQPDPIEVTYKKSTESVTNNLLAKLSIQEANVLRMRYGLNGVGEMTLDQIGDLKNVTRERVRQIESSILRKLRQLLVSDEKLKDGRSSQNTHVFDNDIARHRALTKAVKRKKEFQTTNPAQSTPNSSVNLQNIDAQSSLTSPDSNHTGMLSLPMPVVRILREAIQLGAEVKFEKQINDDSVWIDFSKSPEAPSRQLMRRITSQGFQLWAGRWIWT